jgi:hypothetical protein
VGALQKAAEFRAAGFSDEEISTWAAGQRRDLSQAGFSGEEIDTYFGMPPFNPKLLQEGIRANLQAAPKPVTSFEEALEAGWQISVSGLIDRRAAPEKVLSPDAPFHSRIASSVATFAGDFPAMFGGAMLATAATGGRGGPILSMAGAFALPAGLRATFIDA